MTTNATTVSFAQGTAPVGDPAVFEIYIKATPERIWAAITDPAYRAKYSFGVQTQSDWATGSTPRGCARGRRHRPGREPCCRPPRLRPVVLRSVERRGEGSGDNAGHLGDRASGGLLPAHGRARPAPGERERRAVRRLADDPLPASRRCWSRRHAHHAGLAHVRPRVRHDGRARARWAVRPPVRRSGPATGRRRHRRRRAARRGCRTR